jgi:oligopeptide transport system substrate-binding protein
MNRANVAYNFYAAGQADLIMNRPSPLLLDALKKEKDFHISPYLGVFFIRFNCSQVPFKDPRVRQAFALVIDRRRLTEKITRAGELPAESFVPPGILGYISSKGLGYDPERARTLLAEAGYPGGKNFPLTNYLYSEGESNEGIALELQSMWQHELGVSILLERREWKVYLSSMNRLDFGMAISNWIGDYADPNTFLDLFVTGGGNNRTGWSSQAYDHYLKEASAEINPQRRFATLHDAEDLLVREETPIVPLFFNLGIQLYRHDQLGGIEPNLLDKHPLSQIYRK